MDATAKITIKGKDIILKFGLKASRRLRLKVKDINEVSKMSADEFLPLLFEIGVPDIEKNWKDEDELLDLLDDCDPGDLKKVVNAFNASMGFIQEIFQKDENEG